jgi:hypothetical protein
MVKSAGTNTRASDIDFVYGVAKIFDPESVVREGEMTIVKKTASLPDQIYGTIQSVLTGGSSLTPAQRAAILEVSANRVGEYESGVNEQVEFYKGITERRKGSPDNILPKLPKVDREAYDHYVKANKKEELPAKSAPSLFSGKPDAPQKMQAPDKDGWITVPGSNIRIREKKKD